MVFEELGSICRDHAGSPTPVQPLGLSAATLLTLLAAAAWAQPATHGGEFQVNTFTTSYQREPAVAADGQGRFVVVWESAGQDGSASSVQGRRFDASGLPLTAEFQVNSHTPNLQSEPAVAATAAGHFMVVWASQAQDGSDTAVRGRVFNAGGSPLGPDFAVNTFTTGRQDGAAVTSDSQGNFIVIWQSWGQDGSSFSVQARRFDSAGGALGAEFQVNSYTTGNQERPGVATDTAGNFVVVWQSDGSLGPDTSLASVQARYFDATGSPSQGAEFVVNTYSYDNQVFPKIAADGEDRFIVVWRSDGSFGTDHSASSIQGQLLDFQGGLGDEFQINTYETGSQSVPAVAAFGSLGYVVTWESDPPSAIDPNRGIRARPNGAGEFQVNSYTTDDQHAPAVAADGHGNFVIVWESYGSSGTDNDSTSIQLQLYDALFRDGYESADTSRWSAAVP